MKKITNKAICYILSFLIPLLFLCVILYFKEVLTGKVTLLMSDLNGQYFGLLKNFKSILEGTNNFFYSFNIGFGSSFFSTFAYYLNSPLNLLCILFDNIERFTIFLIIIKMSLCGLTMFTYLKYHFKDKNISLLCFSTAYSLSLFMIGNYFQIMWQDGFIIAPLVLIGIDKIVEEQKSLFYGITLFLTITLNYYIGYMTCIFSVLYFLYRVLLKYNIKDNFKLIWSKLWRFTLVSILAGMMSMIINYPNLLGIMQIDRSFAMSDYFTNKTIEINFFGNLENLFIGSKRLNEALNFSDAYLYCGMMIIPLLYLYFVNKKFSKKEKILSAILLIILPISIFIYPINNAWHAFSQPIGFNFRYVFLFQIFILYLCCKSFINLNKIKPFHYLIIILLFCIIGLAILINTDIKYLPLYSAIFLVFIYVLLFYMIGIKKGKDKKILSLLFIFLSLAELYFNAHLIFINSDFELLKEKNGRLNEREEALNIIKEYDDSIFYRVEFNDDALNSSMLNNYYSASQWYSTVSNNIIKLLGRIGYKGGINAYNHEQSIINDSLFGIKYYITDKEIKNYELLETYKVSQYGSFLFGKYFVDKNIMKNPFSLSLGYMVNNSVKEELNCSEEYICQQQILDDMTNINKPLYKFIEIEKVSSMHFRFIIEDKSDFTLAVIPKQESKNYTFKTSLNGMEFDIRSDEDISNAKTIINSFEIGDVIDITIEIVSGEVELDVIAYYYSLDNFIDYYNVLSKNQLEIIEFEDGYVKGNIHVDEAKTMFISIPYEKGWNAYVDGKKTEIFAIYDAFLGIDLEEGDHEIILEYKQRGLITGTIISSTSLLGFVIYLYFERKNRIIKKHN